MKKIVTGQKVRTTKLQWAKELRREMTEEERILWQHLRTNQMKDFHFRRQQIIEGFIVDFYCHRAELVLEVDGPIHENQTDYDTNRDQILSDRGLKILRFKNHDAKNNLTQVLDQIQSYLISHPSST